MSSVNEDELIRAIAEKLIQQAKKRGKPLPMLEAVAQAVDHVATINGITSRIKNQPSEADGIFAYIEDIVNWSDSLRTGLAKSYDMDEDEVGGKVNMVEIMAMLLYILLTQYPDVYLYYISKTGDPYLYEVYFNYGSS